METLADRITRRRVELGLTSTDISNMLGVSLPAVRKWELESTTGMRHDHLFALADILNLNPRWLATGEGERIASPQREARRFAERKRGGAQNPRERGSWEKLASAFAKAAMVMAFVIPGFAPDKAEASVLHNVFMDAIHIFAQLFRMLKDFASQELAISLSRIIDGHQDKFSFC